MKSNIFIVTHKQVEIPRKDGYSVITVGKDNLNFSNAFSDKTGDNISEKNPYYCELTAHYWMWKNYKEEYDYIGLVHYRRFFEYKRKIISERDIERIFAKNDGVLLKKYILPCTVREYYSLHGYGKEKDIALVENIISKKYPDYQIALRKVLNGNSASYCNMFIFNKKDFIKYSGWLFDILGELESLIDIADYSKEEARVFGYVSEILLNVWAEVNLQKIKYLPFTNPNESADFFMLAKKALVQKKNQIIFNKKKRKKCRTLY